MELSSTARMWNWGGSAAVVPITGRRREEKESSENFKAGTRSPAKGFSMLQNFSLVAALLFICFAASLLILPLLLPPLPPPPPPPLLLVVPVAIMAVLVFLAFAPPQQPNIVAG
ncbi:hypothetical protein M569_14138 [Genlisea aurea]|uniref:Uncharacterized protein n=1 Tax=Genlisea aurea TaxID=192259 RepID=S8C1M2_9LAMI|nr:hypothetical protein M569_14138 [Genlisea aurea]